MPTVAGQFSSVMPIGAKTGVMPSPMAASTDRSVLSLPKLPSVPTELRKPSTTTTAMIILLALSTKALRRSQVVLSTPPNVGIW